MDISGVKDKASERMTKVKDTWKEMDKNRRIAIIAALAVVIAAIGLSIYFLTRKDYVVLYSGMDATEAGEIYNTLKDGGTDVSLRGSDTILVDAKKVDEIRLQLSAQGYPKSGLNYDIFEGASSFGTTDMEKQVYLKFQLEQNLSQTIKRLGKIQDATVMITLASESQFALSGQNSTPASASVVLDIAQGQSLSKDDAVAIRNLIAKSIPNLQNENITIVDSNMKMYTEEELDGTDINTEQLALQQQTKNNLEQQILNLLTPVFGQNRVSTSVNVVLNFDKRVTTSVTFEPPNEGEEQGLIVSLKELREVINGGEGADGAVGVDPNGGVTTYPTTEQGEDGTYYKTTREFNAEVNETKDQIEHARGKIEDLSISVILDGDEAAISNDVLTQVSDLVSKGIGVEPENVSVARMAFRGNQEQAEAVAAQNEMLQRQITMKYVTYIIIAAIVLLALGAIGLIYFLKKKKEKQLQQQLEEELAQPEMPSGIDLLADEDISIDDLTAKDSETTEKIFKLVQNNPEAVAQLLRNWLDDEYGR